MFVVCMFIFGWQNIQYRFLMFLGCPLTLYMSATEVAKLGLSRKARWAEVSNGETLGTWAISSG